MSTAFRCCFPGVAGPWDLGLLHVLMAEAPPDLPDAPGKISGSAPSLSPQGGSCYFHHSDWSRPPKERPFTPPFPLIATPGSGWRSRLQYKEGAEPMFWSLLGTELSCFYSSHRPYILPGD